MSDDWMELEVILLLSIYAAVCKSQVSTVDYIYVLCIQFDMVIMCANICKTLDDCISCFTFMEEHTTTVLNKASDLTLFWNSIIIL